jgi:hypothetical protein
MSFDVMTYRNDDPENPRSRYIIECMATKGDGFTVKTAVVTTDIRSQPRPHAIHARLTELVQFEPSSVGLDCRPYPPHCPVQGCSKDGEQFTFTKQRSLTGVKDLANLVFPATLSFGF